MHPSKFRYTLKPEAPHPAHPLSVTFRAGAGTTPPAVDLRPSMPPVYDQGQLGSCTSFACASAYQFLDKTLNGSRLFLYYNERVLDGDVGVDGGSQMSTGIRALQTSGLCAEATWPYVISKFADVPPAAAFTEGIQHLATRIGVVIQDELHMKTCLASGYPFVTGIAVYASFESDAAMKTGVVPMPSQGEALLGYHAIVVVGYDDAKGWWICRNSWGVGVMDKGYFYLPYAYLDANNLASDMWVITGVSSPPAPPPPPAPPAPSCRCTIA